MESFVFCGAGKGGVDELQLHLKDSSVQWALVRVSLGSGCFQREKTMFLHMNGANCPAVRRWRANELTQKAQYVLAGECEGFLSLEVNHVSDVTHERILSRIQHLFVVDNVDGHHCGWTIKGKAKTGRLRRRVTEPSFPSDRNAPRIVSVPSSPSRFRFESVRDALRSVADTMGAWNWLLVGPDASSLPLVSGGSGCVDEMCASLREHSGTVLFGVVRLSFGTGRLRCVKHVFVHATGEQVPAVKRGLQNGERAAIERAMSEYVIWTTTFEMTRLQDFTVDALIDRVRRSSSLDNTFLHGDKCPFSLKFYRDAQTAEHFLVKERFSVKKTGATSARRELQNDFVVDSLVKLVRVPGSHVNWILLGARGMTNTVVGEEAALDECRRMLSSLPARCIPMWATPKSMIAATDTDTDTDDATTEWASESGDDETDIE